MVDALLLVLALCLLTLGFFTLFGANTMRAQTLRYQSATHQAALVTALEKTVVLTDNAGNKLMAASLLQGMDYAACTGLKPANLDSELKRHLDAVNAGKSNYIMVSNNTLVYDKQSEVCLDSIPLAAFSYTTSCGKPLEVRYGSWPTWMNPPTKC
jgi:hypothetical protein